MLPSSPRPVGLPSNPRPRSRIPKDNQTSEYPRSELKSSPASRRRDYSPNLPPPDSRGIAPHTSQSYDNSPLALPSPGPRVESETRRPWRTLDDTESRPPLSEESSSHEDIPGPGDAIWNRVATVASSLTLSVSKAWSANVVTSAGEETPPGQESHLIRAMKAYHLEKARSPTDLPTWLFDDGERRYSMSRDALGHENDSRLRPQALDGTSKPRGLRDIYDTYRSDTPILSQRVQKNDDRDRHPSSRATDRLKALRDAKRAAAKPVENTSAQSEKSSSEHEITPKVATQRPRVGLPSGPRPG